ncbi:hypothetical protein AMK59_7937 [Oryctes borbonicus]|uniref:Uncharacterized protein n=1 Tax=Oryctes borbonicus TaxID=1629725 RepID=A0A0T6AUB1_9SCAR|nr:hypothetical protein AMK59_7937 [Oryctes borbonicus]
MYILNAVYVDPRVDFGLKEKKIAAGHLISISMKHFVEQVEILMNVQQNKYVENVFGNVNNYNWLINKKPSLIWISAKDEFKIRMYLRKLNEDQTVQVMKQLIRWVEEHPNISALKVPEICVNLLSKMVTSNVVNAVTMSRMNSLRNSLRRFSSMRNKVVPDQLNIPSHPSDSRRSVTFSEELQVYQIYST